MTTHPRPLRCRACGFSGPEVGYRQPEAAESDLLCDACDELLGALLRSLIWRGFLRDRATPDDLAELAERERREAHARGLR